MSTSNKKLGDGGRAFPVLSYIGDTGMSLRDYFAGQAMAGLMANSDLVDLFAKGFAPSKAVEIVFMVADAMLAARTAEGGVA